MKFARCGDPHAHVHARVIDNMRRCKLVICVDEDTASEAPRNAWWRERRRQRRSRRLMKMAKTTVATTPVATAPGATWRVREWRIRWWQRWRRRRPWRFDGGVPGEAGYVRETGAARKLPKTSSPRATKSCSQRPPRAPQFSNNCRRCGPHSTRRRWQTSGRAGHKHGRLGPKLTNLRPNLIRNGHCGRDVGRFC